MDGHRGHGLVQREACRALAQSIDRADEIPARRVRHTRCLGMHALARQDVRQADPRRQHLHPHLACPGSRDISFDDSEHVRAVVIA